jgi:hypothetical protein
MDLIDDVNLRVKDDYFPVDIELMENLTETFQWLKSVCLRDS